MLKRFQHKGLAALAIVIGIGVAGPAAADDWHRHGGGERDWQRHEWHRHMERERWERRHYYVPPPVYALPPPRPVYAPPPVVVMPSPVPGFTVMVPIQIR